MVLLVHSEAVTEMLEEINIKATVDRSLEEEHLPNFMRMTLIAK